MGGGGIEPPRQAFQAYTLPLSYPLNILKMKVIKSKYKLVKRYARFSNTCVYLVAGTEKKIRYGYKVYQKIFRRYRSRKALRVNVRKPRISVKRKTIYGKAMEMKEKLTYLLGGLRANKLKKYVHKSKNKKQSPIRGLLDHLERRLDIILYRTNLIHSPFILKGLIKLGFVKVNGKRRKKFGFSVPDQKGIVDLVIPAFIYIYIKEYFTKIIKRRLIFKPYSEYSEISYRLFRTLKFKIPDENEVFFPFDFKVHYFFRLYPR